jgi:hypothetical protein
VAEICESENRVATIVFFLVNKFFLVNTVFLMGHTSSITQTNTMSMEVAIETLF